MNFVLDCNYYYKKKQGGSNSDKFNDEIVAIVDKILEYKCITKKQHKQMLNKWNLLDKYV